MQPSTLAILITLIPLFAFNGAYLHSAYAEIIPWCYPYIDGCTTISGAARSGNALFWFRGVMITHGVLLVAFWFYVQQWLDMLYGESRNIARTIAWMGIIGALFLIVYVDFLGSSGEINRFMRRFGILFFFTLTPLAQLLLLNQHFKLIRTGLLDSSNLGVLRYQLILLLMMLLIGLVSVYLDLMQIKTYESENIVEWNYTLLLTLYFAGMIFIWKDFKYYLKR